MATVSAGILMYHCHGSSLVVLLVHPGGPYWRNRDLGAWSIPKGELGEAEDAESAARREFKEELGIEAVGPFHPLGDIRERSGKMVRAFALKGDIDVTAVHTSKVTIERPPRSGRTIRFPEIDRAAWLDFLLRERRYWRARGRFWIAWRRSPRITPAAQIDRGRQQLFLRRETLPLAPTGRSGRFVPFPGVASEARSAFAWEQGLCAPWSSSRRLKTNRARWSSSSRSRKPIKGRLGVQGGDLGCELSLHNVPFYLEGWCQEPGFDRPRFLRQMHGTDLCISW
jgi:predicted NUDIX family NTP pyrophosphohydrolase